MLLFTNISRHITRWRSWFRQRARSRKVAGSVLGGVTGKFSLPLSFRSHYGLGFHSPSNRNEYQEYFLGGKGGRCVGLTTLPPSCADCLEIWEAQPPGTVWACPGLYWNCFTCLTPLSLSRYRLQFKFHDFTEDID